MTVIQFGTDMWFVVHPGLSQNPNDYPPDTHYMSYEFATWITGWERGVIGNDAYHKRNFKIARRKSCYPQPLMNELGLFSADGREVLARAQSYMMQIKRYYESVGVQSVADIPTWNEVTEMDRILIAGIIETRHIAFLRALYARQYPDKSIYTHMGLSMPNDIEFEYTKHNDKEYMTTGPLRNFPNRRKSLEYLVKMGLVELHDLPKSPLQHGRGKAPVGVRLSGQGCKLFEDYLARYDPITKKKLEISRRMQDD